MIMMNSYALQLLVLVLLSLSNTEANYCNIFSEEFQQQDDVARRCNAVHKAVTRALSKDGAYQYMSHEVFSINSFHRPPTAIIFHYKMKFITDESTASYASRNGPIESRNGSISADMFGPIESAALDENDNIACEKQNCTFNVGWSSASVYTFVRPQFILSLLPAWFLNSLEFSIHEHFGFLREATIHMPFRRQHLPVNTTVHEIMHSLQHATAEIKASNAGSTYIWKPISKTYRTKFIEIVYIMIVLIVSSVSIVFLLYIIPYSKSDELCRGYPLVGIGFALQWLGNIGLEIYHITETYDHGVYGNLRITFMVVAQLVIDILCMVSVFAYAYMHKKTDQETLKIAAYHYTFVVTFGWSLLRQLIMLLFFAFVYFTEPISTVGIVTFGVIFTFMWSYLSKFVYKKVLAIGTNSIKYPVLITYTLVDVFVYFSINALTYFAIMMYITFLNSLPKAPVDSLIKLICAFLPSLLAAGFTVYLKKWAKKQTSDPAAENGGTYGSLQVQQAQT